MTNYQINQILLDWLNVMPQAPPILNENVSESAAIKQAAIFLVTHFIPADAEQVDYCYTEQKTGIFQVTVVGERNKGRKSVQQMADNIADHFKFHNHDGVIITKAVAATAITTETQYQIPVSIYYFNKDK
ncbi:DUF4128 domain-containing protein [Vitreoscilla massiliensis]|uniref:DUF4128 domain-containing protein n=1 Tax=Vitreoscilla massiliensis TaxID=1689272 RepID=A0ABY4E2A7_9NEIS|nr:phage tail terminator-like protein [Vitreoscilla massiliensis]UOO89510.1 DUF4128 domain-containing protein [Vitreoscilla massiliensis]